MDYSELDQVEATFLYTDGRIGYIHYKDDNIEATRAHGIGYIQYSGLP